MAVAIRLLQMTAAAGHFLTENRLYKAHRLLQRVRDALPDTPDEADKAAGRCQCTHPCMCALHACMRLIRCHFACIRGSSSVQRGWQCNRAADGMRRLQRRGD